MPNPDSKDSLQKKLSDKAFDIKRIDKLVFRSRGGWKEVGGVLFKNMVRLSDVEEAVRTIVSQIQDRIDKLVQDRNRVPLKTLSRILELEWAHFLITGETYKALLVSPAKEAKEECENIHCPNYNGCDKNAVECRDYVVKLPLSEKEAHDLIMTCPRVRKALLEGSSEKAAHCRNPHEMVYRGCTNKCKFFAECEAIEKEGSASTSDSRRVER